MPPQTKGQCLPATAIKKKPSTGFICTRGCGCFFRDRCWGADSHTEEDKEKWRREAELKQQLHQIRVEQTIARLLALQHLHDHEAASSTKKTGAKHTTAEMKTSSEKKEKKKASEAASSTKKTGATNMTAEKKTSSEKKLKGETKASDDSKGSRRADASKPKPAFVPYESLETDSPAMKASFAKYRAALQEEQAQAASKEATKQKTATKKKEGSPIWQDSTSDSAECWEPSRIGSVMTATARRRSVRNAESDPTVIYALIAAESD